MFARSRIKSAGSLMTVAILSLLVAVVSFYGCNDHHFTPVAEIAVLPSTMEYSVQKTTSNSRQVLITNKSVSAMLDLYEVTFKDDQQQPLTLTEEVQDEQGNMLQQVVMQTISDQSDMMSSLKTERRDGTAINYTTYASVLVSDVPCDDNSTCHCNPEETDCTDKERLGELFTCEAHPQNSGESVCQAYFEFYNNAGRVKVSSWGGATEFPCTTDDECKGFGEEFQGCSDGVCHTDIKMDFALEYGLEQFIAIKNDVISNKDKAAEWKSIDGRALCLKKTDAEGNVSYEEGYSFYGLNRCDQMALKQKINAISDGKSNEGFELHPKLQATFRVLSVPNGDLEDPSNLDRGQSLYVTYCDDHKPISFDEVMLVDPIDVSETCETDGLIKVEEMSVASVDDIKIDQLPVRVLYKYDSEFAVGSTQTSKTIMMSILSSALDGDTFERDVQLYFKGSLGGPPSPLIVIPDDYQNPEPLDIIHLDGRQSTSPFGDSRKPFEYWWEWAPGGKPAHATDAVLIASTGTFDNPVSIMGKWTADGYPKIFFPIAGTYKIRLKVRDSAGQESGPNSACPECETWYTESIVVKPSQKIHVELTWDRGDDVDFDMFLVRYRTDGTFAMYTPAGDKSLVTPKSTAMPECGNDDDASDDCYNGAFACGSNNTCVNSCATDADCTAVDPGWYCKTENNINQCFANKNISCNVDSDCPNSTYCTPVKIGLGSYEMVCTKFEADALNDTCSHIFKTPRWGDYEALSSDDEQMQCTADTDCNGVNYEEFTCDAGSCDFSCDSSSQCLTYSDQFICSQDAGFCLANSVDDDPTLDIDDVNGWGPENISVKDPSSGIYRVVVRLYADPNRVVGDGGPSSAATATVQIYLNGERAISDGIAHEFYGSATYWKVADIVWDENLGEKGAGTVLPVCAGWTKTECSSSEECINKFSDNYACNERVWDQKYCSSCTSGEGTPEECLSTIACTSDADCYNETGKVCTTIKGSYCQCEGANEFGEFSVDPYANPFTRVVQQLFDPNSLDPAPRSIWCDSSEDSSKEVPNTSTPNATSTIYKTVDILEGGKHCTELYQ